MAAWKQLFIVLHQLLCLAVATDEEGLSFVVEFSRLCDSKCVIAARRAAYDVGCRGCNTKSLGYASEGNQDFMKIVCKKGGTATAAKIKAKMLAVGVPVLCADEDGILYAQEHVPFGIEPASRLTDRLIWNVDEMDGNQSDGKRCENSLLGFGVLVAVVDTGCTPLNVEDEFREISCKNYVNDTVSPPCRDVHGHGTHVAGVVASEHYGVAPLSSVACLRVLGDEGRGSFSNFIRAIMDLTEFIKGKKISVVTNLSLAGKYSQVLNDVVKVAARAGLYITIAAGNFNSTAEMFSPPSATDNDRIFAVGSHDKHNQPYFQTNFGKLVQLTAPGVNIESDTPDGGSKKLSGTSMASPHVAGAMAALLSDGLVPSLELLQSASTVLYPNGVEVHKAKYVCHKDGEFKEETLP